MHDLEAQPLRAAVVAVQLPGVDDVELEESLAELARLARTLGYEVTAKLTQRMAKVDHGAYLGSGKREELKALVEGEQVDTVLVDHDISPSQARNLEKECGAEVLDRTGLIIEIFHRHAHSKAARAQVEIVRLKYLAPRMREQSKLKGKASGRQRGGVGGRGAGDTRLELDRRKLRDRLAELSEELKSLDEERKTRRSRRQEMQRVALVGYTNAGKSTLMRALTGSDVYIADKLFATLDTTVRALAPETKPRILVSDTVGFIKKLPHGLVDSFKSTLEEALEASLLVHVVDASSPGYERQLQVTESVLAEIGAGALPRLTVFNKIDRVPDPATAEAGLRNRWPDALVISALRPDDVIRLRDALVAHFREEMVEAELRVPYDRQHLRGVIFESCEVLEERYEDDAVTYRTRARPGAIEKLRRALADQPA